jgi:hypothetical protein
MQIICGGSVQEWDQRRSEIVRPSQPAAVRRGVRFKFGVPINRTMHNQVSVYARVGKRRRLHPQVVGVLFAPCNRFVALGTVAAAFLAFFELRAT